MNLALNSVKNEPVDLALTADVSGMPELSEAGGIGPISARLSVTPLAGDSLLVRGQVRGNLAVHCGRCLEKLDQPFSVQFNLLVENRDETGLEWLDELDGGVEDYQVRLGPDVTDIPLDRIIAEQVLLNYNLHPLPDLDGFRRCVQCGRQEVPGTETPKKANRIDPRWDKLKEFSDGSSEKKKLHGPPG